MRRLWLFSVAVVIVAFLAACGDRTSTLPPLPGTANSNTGPTLSAPTTNGQTDGVAAYFTFLVPAGSGVARSPLYLSLDMFPVEALPTGRTTPRWHDPHSVGIRAERKALRGGDVSFT
jgi:hypothetical protein